MTVARLKPRGLLTDLQIRHADDGYLKDGLGVRIDVRGNSKRALLRYRYKGEVRQGLLGHWPDMSLQAIRDKRDADHALLEKGIDPYPRVITHEDRGTHPVTLEDHVHESWTHVNKKWTSERYRSTWKTDFALYLPDQHTRPIGSITEGELVRRMNWLRETHYRISIRFIARLNKVFRRAYRLYRYQFPGDNPTLCFSDRLPEVDIPLINSRVGVAPHLMPACYATLRHLDDPAAHGLVLMILSCSPRPGPEITEACWGEFDLVPTRRSSVPTWHVNPDRLKGRRRKFLHELGRRIPLSKACVEFLLGIRPIDFKPSDALFPSRRPRKNKPATMTQFMHRSALVRFLVKKVPDYADYDAHGFRNSLTDWSTDSHDQKYILCAQIALNHVLKNIVVRAYTRTDQFDLRLEMAEEWATFLGAYDYIPATGG